jgi:streptogramin lyase
MKPSRIVLGCILASLSFLAGGAGAQMVTEFSAGISAGAAPTSIAAGPDGNLWFIEPEEGRIGRITPAGVITEFSVTGGPTDITAGPDGNLWFAEQGGNRIGRITPLGVVTEFSASSTIVSAGPLSGV